MRKFLATAPLGCLAVLGIATPATAGTDQCWNGAACVWKNSSYTNLFRGMVTSSKDYHVTAWSDGTFSLGDEVSSVRSQGNTCRVKFFRNRNYEDTDKFIYFNRVADGSNYQDPYLSNGGGAGPWAGENWNDRISSHRFVDCT